MVAKKAIYLVTDMNNVDFLRRRLEWRNDDLHDIVIPHLRDLRQRYLDNEKHRDMLKRIATLEKILRDLREENKAREEQGNKQADRINALLEQLLQKKGQNSIIEAASSDDAAGWEDLEHDLRDASRKSNPLSKSEARAIMKTFKEEYLHIAV